MSKLPPPTAYSINRIFDQRDALYDIVFDEVGLIGYQLSGDILETAIIRLNRHLPTVKRQVIEDTLRPYAGTFLDYETTRNICWRIAGNMPRLKSDKPVEIWTRQPEYEWVPVQVVSYAGISVRGQPRCHYEMRCLAGTSCTLLVQDNWSIRFVHFVARRVGFTGRRHKCPMRHPAQLVSLRLLVCMDPKLCRDRQPRFRKFECPSSMVKWNRSIIGKRSRWLNQKPWYCPQGFEHTCHECHIGYMECEAACHRLTGQPVTQ
jgi:hypothetical protein